MCGYYFIRFTKIMRKSESLLDYANLFYPNKYENNDKLTLKYFQ